MQSDKRKAPRKPLRYSAWIAIEGENRQGCVLSDVSDTGARIEVEQPNKLPDEFVLLLAASNAPRRHCKVIWRDDTHVGVQFRKGTATQEIGKAKQAKKTEAPALVPEADASEEISETEKPAS